MNSMAFNILLNFYQNSNTDDTVQLIQESQKDNRYLDIDGLWQTSDCYGKRTDELWQIQLSPEAMIYGITKYKVVNGNKILYSNHNLIIKRNDQDNEFIFVIGQPCIAFNLCKYSSLSNGDYQSFLCTNGEWDADWYVSKFTLEPLLNCNNVEIWKDFTNKTFVRISDKSLNYFQKMLDEYEMEDAHPETHVEIDNAQIAFTRNALFVGVHLKKESHDIVLKINLHDSEFDDVIDGLDKLTHNSNIVICTTADGKQYLGLDEMNLYIDIEMLLEDKSNGRPTKIRNIEIDTSQIEILEFNDTFKELFS